MSHQFIVDLQEGWPLRQFFILRQVEPRVTKEGKPFLNLVLGDRSGTIRGRVWEETLRRCPDPLAACDFVGVAGKVEAYQGELQININYIEPVEKIRARGGDLKGFDPELVIPATDYNREDLWRELWEMAATHIDPPLQQLVLAILTRYQSQLMEWPGAEFVHHAYFGGLLEHTWSMARHALRSLEVYSTLNKDLVLAGAILHDLGKIKELTNPECPQRSVPGGLVGHIVLGWEMMREEARIIDFPDNHLLMELEHIIIAHHGSEEFGSPVLPKTPEAFLVYYLDEIDAKLHMAQRHLERDSSEGDFTIKHYLLQRRLYKARDIGQELAGPEPETEE